MTASREIHMRLNLIEVGAEFSPKQVIDPKNKNEQDILADSICVEPIGRNRRKRKFKPTKMTLGDCKACDHAQANSAGCPIREAVEAEGEEPNISYYTPDDPTVMYR